MPLRPHPLSDPTEKEEQEKGRWSPPASPLLKIKPRLGSAALSAGKWAAFWCSQNRQPRPPGCRQLGATSGTARTEQNLAARGQLTPEGGEERAGLLFPVPSPRLTYELGHSVGRACDGEEPSENLESVASRGFIKNEKEIFFFSWKDKIKGKEK